MYAETTNIGTINLMDIERQDAVRIRDSLRLATLQGKLTHDEAPRLRKIIDALHAECEGLTPRAH